MNGATYRFPWLGNILPKNNAVRNQNYIPSMGYLLKILHLGHSQKIPKTQNCTHPLPLLYADHTRNDVNSTIDARLRSERV